MNIEANKTIGRCLQRLRIDAGITQAQLAEELHKPQSYVSKIEIGERSLQVYELFDYSQALGLSPEEAINRLETALSGWSGSNSRQRS